MNQRLNRRDFLAASAATGVALATGPAAVPQQCPVRLRKAIIGRPTEELLRQLKAAGFDGLESGHSQATPDEAAKIRQIAAGLGVRIHSVLYGWGELNGNTAAVAKTVGEMETALLAARAYGAETVLFVPCRIGGMAMPKPWELAVRFDEKTGHVRQVVAGDNAKYGKYIDAHNHAVDTSREGLRTLIPTAAKAGVMIALENVWNNLWVVPDLFANFVASFRSPWVKAYFDIGNHVKYAPPQQWIRTLGPLLVKCHVKDFKLNADGRDGRFCPIREGSVNWPTVMRALGDVGYHGWLTIEGSSLPLGEQSRRLDLIIAGK